MQWLGKIFAAGYFCRRMQPAIHHTPITDKAGLDAGVVYQAASKLGEDVSISVIRYERTAASSADDSAVVSYHIEKGISYLELRYCVSGNMYCRQFGVACSQCKLTEDDACQQQVETTDEVWIRFSKQYLSQFAGKGQQTLSDAVLAFTQPQSFNRSVTLCNRSKTALQNVVNNTGENRLASLAISTHTQQLLLYALESIDDKVPEQLNCRFLNNEADRAKILLARDILLQQLGEPVTIKQLSRRVAMNECYLKKGFKEVFGTTIFEFYQEKRMQHARYLLYDKGLSVTEVSELLGYSSISHFSTAFKKHTGLKPCELLFRGA